MSPFGRILLIDNSRSFAALLAGAITARLDLPVLVAGTLSDALATLDAPEAGIGLVISGLVLPDADEAEIIESLADRGYPLVVLTGRVDAAGRERILARGVIDYVLKDNPGSVDYVVWLVRRLARNRALTALVVEDSPSFRGMLGGLLRLYGFTVLEASDGLEALAIAEAAARLDLLVTDYAMPGLDGIGLVRRLRARFPRDRLAIIGISTSVSHLGPISAQFIKNGANDYLPKPFLPEELFCRIAQNIEHLETLAALDALAATDSLTGLANRRAFFDSAPRLLAAARRGGRRVAVGMIDIDHFKRINDSFGHDCGDAVLSGIARRLAANVRQGDLLARLGGEEFCLLALDPAVEEESLLFERLRRCVTDSDPSQPPLPVAVSLSIGVCTDAAASLESLLKAADQALYRAKQTGRDRVVLTRTAADG